MDRGLTGFTQHRAIPIRHAARALARPNFAGSAPANLVREVFEKQRSNETTDTNRDLIGLAFMDLRKVNIGVLHLFEDVIEIANVAGQAVETFNHDHISATTPRKFD